MIINKPYIEIRNDSTFLISTIYDEIRDIGEEFYFSVPNEYGQYLVDEVADAFVVAMLPIALISGQNIEVKASISEILFYQIENSMIYTLCKVFEKKPIKILAASTVSIDFHPDAIATGFSGGIDSFTTVLQHTSENCPETMRLTHLSLFNIGSYGNDELGTFQAFEKDATRAQQYAEYVNMPLILLNSNIMVAYRSKEISFFTSRMTISIIAGVLAMQKLFKVYLIASSKTIDEIRLNKLLQCDYEFLVSSILSTNNTKIIIANGNINRVEKTKIIAEDEKVQKFLYVCLADILNETSKAAFLKDTKVNCSECYKCLRTIFTLDILGLLDKYSDRFDLQKYAKNKMKYTKYILNTYKTDKFSKEIYDLMIEMDYKIPIEIESYKKLIDLKDQILSIKVFKIGYLMIVMPLYGYWRRIKNRICPGRHRKIEKFLIGTGL